MLKEQKDHLFLLVKSLTKSEKRQFKLYVGRLGVNTDSKFLNLFNLLDKAKTYDEPLLLKSGIVKKEQLANVKSHLYKQILISLKLNPSRQNIRSQIREQLDFASILYHKGLYNQSLKILDKAKSNALLHEEKNSAFEIIELEKIIESQYITRSIDNRANELTIQSENLSRQNTIASTLSNLSLQLYSIILKKGYIKNKEEHEELKRYFKNTIPEFSVSELGFREKLWLYKANLWYSFLLQDFLKSYKYALKWVDLFKEHPDMIRLNPVFYLKGNNYLLESLFFLRKSNRFHTVFTNFERIVSADTFPNNQNTETLSFLYLNFHRINNHFIHGSFESGLQLIPDMEKSLSNLSNRIDQHHKMIFYYKFACLHFGAGNYDECIRYLNNIFNYRSLLIREDLLCFSRVLNLIAHYEAGLDYHLDHLLKNTYRYLIKMNDMHEVQKEMIKFIKGLQDIYPQDLKKAFIAFHSRLKQYENHPYESRAFLYFDIISWLESKMEDRPVSEIIKNKYSSGS